MQFRKYSSIENGYRERFLSDIQGHPDFPGVLWQVTEKLDGANLSFVVDTTSDEIRPAKRTSICEMTFYGLTPVFQRHENDVLALAHATLGTEVQVFGEFYGEGIQKKVFYGQKQFACFDILVDGFYMDPDDVENLCAQFNIPHAPVLAKDLSFKDAMAFEHEFNSTVVPDRENNTAEGVVLKPSKVMYLHNGNRVIIKNKSKKFMEKEQKVKVRVEATWDEDMQKAIDTMLEFNTENRIRNVISKIGAVTQKDFGKLLGMTCQDILEDWGKDNDMEGIDKKNQKIVTKRLNQEVAKLIRDNFLNIIDGNF